MRPLPCSTTVVQYTFCVLFAWLALFLMLTTEVMKVPFFAIVFTIDHCRISTNYLMVRYPNIKIYATEVKYRFLLLTSVYRKVIHTH